MENQMGLENYTLLMGIILKASFKMEDVVVKGGTLNLMAVTMKVTLKTMKLMVMVSTKIVTVGIDMKDYGKETCLMVRVKYAMKMEAVMSESF